MRRLVLLAVAGLASGGGRADAGFISTVPQWDGASSIAGWTTTGSPLGFETFGQTFTATAANSVLNSIEFQVLSLNEAIPFRAYVFAWGGSGVVGPALFTSAPLTTGPSAPDFLAVSVGTGSLTLTVGQQYVAFYSTIGEGGPSAALGIGGVNLLTDPYAGGKFVFSANDTLASLTSGWDDAGDTTDAAFRLGFADGPAPAVPEPATLVSAGIGGALLLGQSLRKRRTAAAG